MKSEVEAIYQKCSLVFSDIIWLDKHDKEEVKQLKVGKKIIEEIVVLMLYEK